jgi:hypothetical protein
VFRQSTAALGEMEMDALDETLCSAGAAFRRPHKVSRHNQLAPPLRWGS